MTESPPPRLGECGAQRPVKGPPAELFEHGDINDCALGVVSVSGYEFSRTIRRQ